MKRIAWIYRIGPRSTVTSANAALEKLPGLFFKINRGAAGRLAVSDAARGTSDLAFSNAAQQEDIGIREAVQKGLASGSYLAGRLCPRRDSGVHHVDELLRAACRAEDLRC